MTELVIHGHFYQPPRENPWTGMRRAGSGRSGRSTTGTSASTTSATAPTRSPASSTRTGASSASPTTSSASASTSVRRSSRGSRGTTASPTTASSKPIERASRKNAGHGNAIAHAFNHAILPLMSERDRVTQVRWGLADFRRRFGREPEAMWLPETACDDKTLGTLIDEGMLFAILSPYQAARVRDLSGGEWTERRRRQHRQRRGLRILPPRRLGTLDRALFLRRSAGALDRLRGGARLQPNVRGGARRRSRRARGASYTSPPTARATGTTSATASSRWRTRFWWKAPIKDLSFTNYGAFLAAHPPAMEVEIKAGPDGEGTSWSCAHGVQRWYRDCGCQTDGQDGWNQAWRTPLRNAFDFLRAFAGERFEEGAAASAHRSLEGARRLRRLLPRPRAAARRMAAPARQAPARRGREGPRLHLPRARRRARSSCTRAAAGSSPIWRGPRADKCSATRPTRST